MAAFMKRNGKRNGKHNGKGNGKSTVGSVQLAAKSGLTLSTIHYYTFLGLLRVSRRVGNKRLYDAHEATNRLRTIQRLRDAGYPLNLIRAQLSRRLRG